MLLDPLAGSLISQARQEMQAPAIDATPPLLDRIGDRPSSCCAEGAHVLSLPVQMLAAFRSSDAGMDRDRAATGSRGSRRLLPRDFPALPHSLGSIVTEAKLSGVVGQYHIPV